MVLTQCASHWGGAQTFHLSSQSCFKVAFSMFQDLHLKFILVRYGKVTDTKTMIFERRVDYLQFPRTGACHTMPGHMVIREEWGKHGQKPWWLQWRLVVRWECPLLGSQRQMLKFVIGWFIFDFQAPSKARLQRSLCNTSHSFSLEINVYQIIYYKI